MIKGDLHIHTVLSPCGNVEMTPEFIVDRAIEAGYDFIGITDHNSTRQFPLTSAIARERGLSVLCGAEITTKEEIHVLVFVAQNQREILQDYIDSFLIKIPNKPEFFGYQLVVDRQENVVYEEEFLLINAIDQTLEEVEKFTHSIGGLFIPAHVDKKSFSITSQLGFIPPDIDADAFELSGFCDTEQFIASHPLLSNRLIISSSDAHHPNDFGETHVCLDTDDSSFEGIHKYIVSLPRP